MSLFLNINGMIFNECIKHCNENLKIDFYYIEVKRKQKILKVINYSVI